ncbi:MAG: oligopeptide transport system substrate-binding protein [Flavobacterium sp.]|jgi:oligopeptide transport system substrate-binding protein
MLQVVILLSLLFISTSAISEGVNLDSNSITLSMSSEPGTLDSSIVEGSVGSMLIGNFQEGLVKLNRRSHIEPGVAERWEVDGLNVTFWLRQDAKWHDGSLVTAHDFVYAWRRLVDPKTGAGGSTFFAYIFENGKEILAGDKPPESLGVEVINDFQLKIRLSRPTPYFLDVLADSVYSPLQQKFVDAQAGRYAADADNLLANGPFFIESWVHGASIRLTKNPHYWNVDNVMLDAIDFAYITPDIRSTFNLYRNGELAALNLSKTILDEAMEAKLRIRKAQSNCASWFLMNFDSERLTSNLNFRRAISMSIDRDAFVNDIIGMPGTTRIDSVFPSGVLGQNQSFQKEFPAHFASRDIATAKVYLEKVRQELKLKEFPPLNLLTNETTLLQAEFMQAQLMNALGLEVRIDVQTFKQWLVKVRAGDFDISRDGFCSGGMTDPVYWAGIFESTSSWNTIGYHNPRYDELMALTHNSGNQIERMTAFSEMQNILNDDVVIIPTHESAIVYVQDKRIKKLSRYPKLNFSGGKIAK